MLYYGGNAEDVSQSLPILERVFPGRGIHALHYRGYGGSGGFPSEQALVADALALYDALAAGYRHVTVVGRSLGTGIAMQVAAARRCDRLVLITPYHSIVELGQQRFPAFPVRWLLRDRYESWRHAAHISVPTTIIVAAQDQVIASASAYRLARHFPPGIAEVVTIAQAGHGDVARYPQFARAMAGAGAA